LIITRSPLRISLGGGGTDIPSYFKEYDGFVISAAIDKYVYVTITKPFDHGIYLKYSKIEKVDSIDDIKHPIIRESLRYLNLKSPQIEITSVADIPSGTGLGSSGSFTTAVLKGLFSHYRRTIHNQELAELACKIEIDQLQEPIGKQDQYIAAYGGITEFEFHRSGSVTAKQLELTVDTIHDLEDNLLLFYTGQSRSASAILKDQVTRSLAEDKRMIQSLHETKELGFRAREFLVQGRTTDFGALMLDHWERKRARTPGMSNNLIDETYADALKNGAIGGKLVGAGGGGFLMFYASDREKLRAAMSNRGLQEIRFTFEFEGTKVVLS
jgi:D-glycero-alpha-D-manno-heptose-7-phosphate kinase